MQVERDRALNVVGAFALAAADAVRQAAEQTVGQGGAAPAALVTIGAYPGRTIEQLRRPLGLSQPGTLRLVERLEHEGWVAREASTRRGVALSLTKAGQRLVAQLSAAREASLSRLLDHLSDSQLVQIASAAEAVLAAQTTSRADLERLCRLCHRPHCPDCPVASAAPT
jgi:MarR family transcriptional regulator, negative regulator of the multidrug operon emrRAB